MIIKQYQNKYQEQVFDLILHIKVNEEKMRYIKRHDLWTINQSFLCFYVALNEDDEIIGCIGLKKIDDQSVLLSRFYVKAEYRRKGLGKSLFDKVLSYCSSHDIVDMYIGVDYVSKSGIKFYKKHGFERIKEGKFISKDDDITLYKKL